MAFASGGGSGKVRNEINVTPLVDVVLVLLIIYLVAMPVVLRNITIDIPKKIEDQPDVQIVVPDQITVEVKEGGIILLNGQTVERGQLAEKLRTRLEAKRDKVVFVDFDEKFRYGDAVQIMDTIKGAGATTVALKMKEAKEGEPGAPGTPATPGTPPTPPVTPPQ
jgi:biopolymer transport protein ExbD/biopolymer transport protein TolR